MRRISRRQYQSLYSYAISAEVLELRLNLSSFAVVDGETESERSDEGNDDERSDVAEAELERSLSESDYHSPSSIVSPVLTSATHTETDIDDHEDEPAESDAYEILEKQIEAAIETQTPFVVEDHQLDHLPAVSAHVVNTYGVDPEMLNSLISVNPSTQPELSQVTSSLPSENTDKIAEAASSIVQSSASTAQTTVPTGTAILTAAKAEDAQEASDPEQVTSTSAEGQLTASEEAPGSTTDDATISQTSTNGQIRSQQTGDATAENAETNSAVEKSHTEPRSQQEVITSAVTAAISSPLAAIGLRYNGTSSLFSQIIHLTNNNPAATDIAEADHQTTQETHHRAGSGLLAAAVVGAIVWTAGHADRSALVQRIVKRISRSLRRTTPFDTSNS
ncbi:MAG: hypothetical protein KDA85_12745 [Planctomycetaceae bacterium]|nr:hypothetical protein [Planctomycetaceae bacterium]